MFSLAPMFGFVDSKTIKDTCLENGKYSFFDLCSVLKFSIEEYLEKVIEKVPYIGDEYKKMKEEEKERAEKGVDCNLYCLGIMPC